jgi:regulator of RNase E activity RraA
MDRRAYSANMKALNQVSSEFFAFLRHTDTCTVSNAIETFNVRMRNEGYVCREVHCMTPKLPPVAGYAVTARMRAAAPPISRLCYYHRADWWQYVASIAGPKILVIEDVDDPPGAGALVGELHAEIGRALGCVGYLTNGTVRDLAAVEAIGFQCFARGACVSHSYAHVTEFGGLVEIGGLRISPGDLLHGDCSGIHSVPLSILGELPRAVAEIRKHEAELISLCNAPDFSFEKLEDALRAARNWSPKPEVR